MTEKYKPAKLATPEMSILGTTDSLAESTLKIRDIKCAMHYSFYYLRNLLFYNK